jgi:sugar lactone lactonase YvrE
MNRFRCYLIFTIAVSVFAGCAGATNNAPFSASRTPSQPDRTRPALTAAFSRLYVANSGNNTVTMYLHPVRKLKQTISDKIQWPVSVAVDSSGTAYVANCGGACGDDGSVAVISKNGKKVRLITDGISRPESVAVDSQGDLYVANVGFAYETSSSYYLPASISLYAPGSNSPEVVITGVARPSTVALDASGNVYVANHGFVSEYGPQLGSVIRYITIRAPLSFAFDASGNLYVGNNSGRDQSNVEVFAPNTTNPFETIKDGVNQPYAMTMDPAGNLYVANTFGNNVTVYAQGSTTPFATISQGISQPRAITLDGDGNVYVANASANSVTEYAAGTFRLKQTITDGVNYPQWLAFGP